MGKNKKAKTKRSRIEVGGKKVPPSDSPVVQRVDMKNSSGWIDATPTYTYWYNLKTKLGECKTPQGEGEIFVLTDRSPRAYQNVLQISHLHYLKPFFVDIKRGNIICETVGKPIQTYVEDWKLVKVGRQPITTYKLHYKKQFGQRDRDSADKATFDYLHSEIKVLFTQMVRFVCHIHSEGFSLNPYSVADIRMKNEVVKFCGIGFVDAEPFTRKRDFLTLVDVFKILLTPATSFPYTLNCLFSAIEAHTFQHKTQTYLLKRHLAITPSRDVLDFLSKCKNEYCQTRKPDVVLSNRQVVNAMFSCKDWEEKFVKDPAKYKLIVDRYYYKPPNLKKGGEEEDDYRYPQTGDAFYVKIGLMRFMRNFVVHVNDGLWGEDRLTDEHKEAVLIGLFGREIMQFQQVLHEESKLDEFMPQTLQVYG